MQFRIKEGKKDLDMMKYHDVQILPPCSFLVPLTSVPRLRVPYRRHPNITYFIRLKHRHGLNSLERYGFPL